MRKMLSRAGVSGRRSAKVSPPCTPVAGVKHRIDQTKLTKYNAKNCGNMRFIITVALITVNIITFSSIIFHIRKGKNNHLQQVSQNVQAENVALASTLDTLEKMISTQKDELVEYLASTNAGLRDYLGKAVGVVFVEHHNVEVNNLRSTASEKQTSLEKLQSHHDEEVSKLDAAVSAKQAIVNKMNADIEANRQKLEEVKAIIEGKESYADNFCRECYITKDGPKIMKCGVRLQQLVERYAKNSGNTRFIITVVLIILNIITFSHIIFHRRKGKNSHLQQVSQNVQAENVALASTLDTLEKMISTQKDELVEYLASTNAGLRDYLGKAVGVVFVEHHNVEVNNLRSTASEKQTSLEKLQSHHDEEVSKLDAAVSAKQAIVNKMNADIEANRQKLEEVKAIIEGKESYADNFCRECYITKDGPKIMKCGVRLQQLVERYGVEKDVAIEVIIKIDSNCLTN